jgi:osmoprotectant transport system substrate-binding protein
MISMNSLKLIGLLVLAIIGISNASSAGSAQTVVVGGKNFTEQLLIAEMTSQLLEAKGISVRTKTGFSTSGIRQEQEAGLLDIYWEYTGTSLLAFNDVEEKLGPDEGYVRVSKLDARKGLIWLSPSKVNNTYALAMRRADAEAKGVVSISDLARLSREGESFQFACNTEFYIRPDGLLPLERAYQFEFGPQNVVRMEAGAIYEALRDDSSLDVGLVFSTDGRNAAYDFLLLEDDGGFFPAYLLSPVVRKTALDRNPELATHLEELSAKLDNTNMANLNSMVDVQRQSVEDVAALFLRNNGLI